MHPRMQTIPKVDETNVIWNERTYVDLIIRSRERETKLAH